MKKRVTILLVVCLVLVLGTSLDAQQRQRKRTQVKPQFNRGMQRGIGQIPYALMLRFKERLGIDEAQQKKLKVLFENHKKEVGPIQNDLRTLNRELIKAMGADEVNRQTVASLMHKQAQAQADLKVSSFNLRLDVKKVLTPEQSKKLRNLQMMLSRRGRFQRGQVLRRGRSFGRRGVGSRGRVIRR